MADEEFQINFSTRELDALRVKLDETINTWNSTTYVADETPSKQERGIRATLRNIYEKIRPPSEEAKRIYSLCQLVTAREKATEEQRSTICEILKDKVENERGYKIDGFCVSSVFHRLTDDPMKGKYVVNWHGSIGGKPYDGYFWVNGEMRVKLYDESIPVMTRAKRLHPWPTM